MLHNLFQAMHLISPVPGFILHSPNSRVPSLTSTLSSCCCYSLIQEFPKSISFHLPTLGDTDTHTHLCLPWIKCRSTKCHYEACHVEKLPASVVIPELKY